MSQHIPLNAEQQAAVDAADGPWCVLAGPGSGKTRALVARLLTLKRKGVPMHKIICGTFTTAAAEEMAKRAGLLDSQKVFRTFHSLGLDIIMRERDHLDFQLAASPILSGQQHARYIFMLMRKYGLDDYKELTWYISNRKRKYITGEDDIAQAGELTYSYARAYADYLTMCREEGMIDFDSMLLEARKLLRTNDGVRARWQMQHVMVDEAQDTDDLQIEMVQLLSRDWGNVFFVGDPNQSIYAWRGANPDNMLKFAEFFPGGQYLYLGNNYRSTVAIVEDLKIDAPIDSPLVAKMNSASGEPGDPIEVAEYETAEKEAEAAILLAMKDPDNSAILGRTNRLLGDVQDLCEEKNIKHRLLGDSGYWQQEEVRAVMSYAEFICQGTDAGLRKLIRTPFSPTNYIRKSDLLTHLKGVQDQYKNSGETVPSLYSLLPQLNLEPRQAERVHALHEFLGNRRHLRMMPAGEAMEQLIAEIDAVNYYTDDSSESADNEPLKNVNGLARRAKNPRHVTLSDFVRHAQKCYHASRNRKWITLSTVHQAKGKEWDTVIVIGVALDVLPHKKGDLPEEKRIFFVARSRAAKLLRMTYAGTASPFLDRYMTPEMLKVITERKATLERIVKPIQLGFGGATLGLPDATPVCNTVDAINE